MKRYARHGYRVACFIRTTARQCDIQYLRCPLSIVKEQLIKEKEISDFYKWCFDILKQHTEEITLSKYFTVTNLLLEEDLAVDYNSDDRNEIILDDAILMMPKVKIYERISNKT